MGFFDLGTVSPNEFSAAAMLARASYKGNQPSDGWKALSGKDLGFVPEPVIVAGKKVIGEYIGGSFDQNGGGYTFNNGGAAAVIFKKGSELAISFRGTVAPKII